MGSVTGECRIRNSDQSLLRSRDLSNLWDAEVGSHQNKLGSVQRAGLNQVAVILERFLFKACKTNHFS